MFESKYSKYVINNTTRFAEDDEIVKGLSPIDKGAGVPLFEMNGDVYVDNLDNHSITIGGTGCGKSRAVCKSLIRSIILNNESGIINDPKGELYKATANLAEKKGYNVKVLNLRKPECSDRWNPLSLIYLYYSMGELSKAQQAIDDFSTDLMTKTANKDDRYWDMVSASYFSKIIEMCMMVGKRETHITLENILPLCNESGETTLKQMMYYIPDLSEAIKSSLNAVLELKAEKTKSCIYGVLHTGLDSLVKNESLLRLFSGNDISFYKLADAPTLIYVIYPDEKTSMNNVVKCFLTQAYTALLDVCEMREDDKLPIRVNFVLDEFSNLTAVENFDNRISESRSKGIRYHLFCQSMNQLSEKYGENVAETILSNCTSWICFSSKETKFLDSISRLCGKVIDYNGMEKPLISSSEIQFLSKGENGVEVLILRQGVRPYVAQLPYFDKMYPSDKLAKLVEVKRDELKPLKLKLLDWSRLANELRREHKNDHKVDTSEIIDWMLDGHF